MTAQLALNISLQDHNTFSNFLAGQNQQVLKFLISFCRQPTEQFTYLWGPPSSGRSHLLQACCHAMQHQNHTAFYLSAKDEALLYPAVLNKIEQFNLVCIDDIDSLIGKPSWEEQLFFLYNNMREKNHLLIVAGNRPAPQLSCTLPDLESRLSWGLTFQLKLLSDEEKAQALILRASNRGLKLTNESAQYILNRSPRDLTSLFETLDQLDQASIIKQRRLTIPFIKQTLFENNKKD